MGSGPTGKRRLPFSPSLQIIRLFTLNSQGGKIRIDASANGRKSATDARLAPLSAGDTVWLGWLGSEDDADSDYNDGIVILQWPIT
ncbi:hypothetical protein BFF94_015295 [Burkholderia catarinensis]|nr:hypothetical protein BFF94_015295 [Burkholderia catarinensis]